MGRQLNIRSERARELAIRVAKRRNVPITRAVEQALAEADARDEAEQRESRAATRELWNRLLEEDWKHLNDSDFKVEDLYDPETGLPV